MRIGLTVTTEKRQPKWHRPVNILSYILLGASYAVFLLLFVTDNTFLDNTISRATALIDLAGALGFLSFREYLMKRRPWSLLIASIVIFPATLIQAFASLPMHDIRVRVEVDRVSGTGAGAAIAESDIRVQLATAGEVLLYDSTYSDSNRTTFVFSSRQTSLKWNQPETVVASIERCQAVDSQKVGWGGMRSLFAVTSDREVTIRLQAGVATVSVVTTPPDARINLKACDEACRQVSLDTTYIGTDPIAVALGERLRIRCSRQGYYTATDNFGLKPVTEDVIIPISLSPRPASLTVEAYNVGGQPEPMAIVLLDSTLTSHRAFEPFELRWGRSYEIAASLVTPEGDRLQSSGTLLRVSSDRFEYTVQCTLELAY